MTQALIRQTPILENVILGRSPSEDPAVSGFIRQKLDELKPDIICFEQPFLFIGMKDILATEYPGVHIIHSSYNVEEPMLRDIYDQNASLPAETAQTALSDVKAAEESLTRAAQLTITVSQDDARTLQAHSSRQIAVVPNATNVAITNAIDMIRVRKRMDDLGVTKFALFTGSAHPPNVQGLLEMCGTRPGYLPYGASLFVAGSVGDLVFDAVNTQDFFYGMAFFRRVNLWGAVSDTLLGSLIQLASVIVLPITKGGGSNLKTAEALTSGKPIVSTSHAFRGYEKFMTLPRVHIENDPAKFQEAVSRLLRGPAPTELPADIDVEELYWPRQISSVASVLQQLF
jgi:glycosyltransferase involved in cell wall biosynthesis